MAKNEQKTGKAANFKGAKGKQFTSEYQPEGRGRKLSFRKRYQEIQKEANGVIWVPDTNVQTRTREGKKQYGFTLTKVDALLTKLDRLIMKSNESTALAAIKFLWEQYDGKAVTTLDLKGDLKVDNKDDLSKLTAKERDTWLKLKLKMNA